MLLILVAVAIAIVGTIRLTRTLGPGQRIVAWAVFLVAIAWLIWTLVQMGVLGRTSGAGP